MGTFNFYLKNHNGYEIMEMAKFWNQLPADVRTAYFDWEENKMEKEELWQKALNDSRLSGELKMYLAYLMGERSGSRGYSMRPHDSSW